MHYAKHHSGARAPIAWTRGPPAPVAAELRNLLRIRRLGAADGPAVAAHLLALPAADRRARFGAALDAAAVLRHCAQLDLGREIGFGALDVEGALVGLAIGCGDGARRVEVAVSVLPAQRRRGLGAALVARVCGAALAAGARMAVFEVEGGNEAMRGLLLHLGVRPAPGDGVTLLPLTEAG